MHASVHTHIYPRTHTHAHVHTQLLTFSSKKVYVQLLVTFGVGWLGTFLFCFVDLRYRSPPLRKIVN